MQTVAYKFDSLENLGFGIVVKTTNNITTTTKKSFIYEFTTYLKDSNAYGNNYFARYFECN